MQFGIYLNPSTPGPDSDGKRIREVLQQCSLAEQLGFNSVWLTEQHFTPYNTYSDSLVMAGHLAALTPKLRIGFAVVVPSLHHPVRLAVQLALIDHLCGGRLVVGLGVGAGMIELAGFGRDFAERHAIFEETADLLVRLWEHRGGVFEYSTEHYQGRIDGRVVPAPFQRPYPMIARATRDTGRAEEWGKRGQPVLLGSFGVEHLRTMFAAHDAGLRQAPVDEARREAVRNSCAIHHVIHVADSDEAAEREFKPYWEQHLVHHYLANRGAALALHELPPDHVTQYTSQQLVVGSPETVVAKLREYESLGVRQHMVWANVGNCPGEVVERSMRLFAERVLPAFAKAAS